MSSVLVTGAGGFVGRHLVKELLGSGYDVLGLERSGSTDFPSDQHFSLIEIDLMNKGKAKSVDFTKFDAVIHLAGLAAVGPSFDDPMLYVNINMGIEVNLFEAALAQKATPRFLIVSSGTLYDPRAEQPLTEVSPVLPNSPYAVSKIGQEQMAQYYATRGFEPIIARPFNHIGPGQAPGFIVPDFAQQIVAIEKGEQQEMTVGNLDAKRDYTDVRDIVRAYRLLIEKGKSGEIYNICSGQPLSGHEILEGLSQAANIKPEVKQDPDKMRPSDTPVLSGSHDKLTYDTGWLPEIPLQTTLVDVIADWRAKA